MITRDEITQRKNDLEERKKQLSLDMVAHDGAIQDCEYWLGILDGKDLILDSESPEEE